MNDTPTRPLPEITPFSRPHWEGLARGEFLIQQCARCKALRHYPRPVCGACYSMETGWVKASGNAVVHSWTIAHHAYHPAFKATVPYTLVTADLPEGVRLLARLFRASPSPLQIGMPLTIGYERIGDGASLPVLLVND